MLPYINFLIPLILGMIVLLFPQVFTKKDLNEEDNKKTKKRLRLAGIAAIIAGIVIFLSTL